MLDLRDFDLCDQGKTTTFRARSLSPPSTEPYRAARHLLQRHSFHYNCDIALYIYGICILVGIPIFNFLDNRSADGRRHTSQSCLGEWFSQKLQAAMPEATQPVHFKWARFE